MQDFATLAIITVRRKMQLLEIAVFHRINACTQLKRVMKLTGLLILIACLHVSANGITQTINLSFENAPLETVLKDIEKQTGYTFFYRTNWVKQAKKVTVKASNLSLQQALELCFKGQPLDYSVSGKIITIAVKNEKGIVEKKKEEGRADVLVNIKGKVVSPKGEPVAKATVSIKGTEQNTMTDGEGQFSLENVIEDAVLIISSVGYESVEIRTNGKSFINAVLQIKITSLDEFQVIAYGQTTKRFNTGNVSSVKAADIEKQPVNNPLLALQGRVPGMEISQATGVAGSGITIQVRGKNSYKNGNDPLYIIDGVPYASQNLPGLSSALIFGNGNLAPSSPFSYINPADIESIDVLKDADATAIYGSRGANGVILITTKKGKVGDTKISLNAQSGFGKVPSKLHLLDTRQYLEMRNEAFKNDGAAPDPNVDYDLTLWDTSRDTDWQKELIGGTAKYNDIQATVSGGNANTQALIGTGYHRETTVFPRDFDDTKASVHFNIVNATNNKKLKVMLSAIYNYDNNRLPGYDLTDQAMKLPPNAPQLYNEDGSINWAPNMGGSSTWPKSNPAAMLLLGYKRKTNNLISNGSVSYKILPGLEAYTSFGFTNMQTNEVETVPLTVMDPSTWPSRQRRSSFTDNRITSWIIEPQLTYSRKVFKGNLKILVGGTIQKNLSTGQAIDASGFNSDLVLEDIKSATNISIVSSTYSMYRYSAFFGRINYNWEEKYLINITGRRDGTSRFGPSKRFHDFGAVGLGWIFTNEPFVKIPYLSYGKLRGSYGTTGSDQVGDYTYMDLYASGSGVPYMGTTILGPTRLFTPDLAWEETKKAEAGVELGFLKDRILFFASAYYNRSTNQLITYPLAAVTGFTSINKNLNALIGNKGLELELRTQNIVLKNFKWNSSLNVTINRNKLISGPDELGTDFKKKIGHPLSSQFVYRFAGVDPITGLYQITDAKGAMTQNPDPLTDKNYLIDLTPKFYGGFQNSVTYKILQLDIHFLFVKGKTGGTYLYNFIPGNLNNGAGGNQPVSVLDRWQKPGDVKFYQRFSQNQRLVKLLNNVSESNLIYEDASYIRLRNVSLSLQLPDRWKAKIKAESARIYIQGQNLFTITGYHGLDPETTSSTSLPVLRVVTVGLQLTL